MPLLRRFGLHLDPPSAGWLPITLTLDDEVFSWAASDVLNDALAELAAAALALDDEGAERDDHHLARARHDRAAAHSGCRQRRRRHRRL